MNSHKILVIVPGKLSEQAAYITEHFQAESVNSVEIGLEALQQSEFKLAIYDAPHSEILNLENCAKLLQNDEMQGIPLIVLSHQYALQDKLKAFEIGCDDFIDATVSGDEACARVTKSIFNQIANQQLKSRLTQAHQTAHTAMADNSDLGANIQFLLAINDCDNLDELGQQFFATLRRYGLHCSLQMRSVMGDKNMEAHGMAKDLESQLLSQLADADRYIDFGTRTIVNYDKVSLLIKNMPKNAPEKYGAIKDNTFALLQGLNARIKALEDRHHLMQEKASLLKLSEDVSNVMNSLKDSYQTVMCDIVNEVENVAELIQMKLPTLALTEEHENFLENATTRAITETNRIFNDGLKVDECFAKLEEAIEHSLRTVELASDGQANGKKGLGNTVAGGNQDDASIELF